MVVYNCPRCGYSTGNKSYFRKHLMRRNPCKVVLKDIPIKDILDDIEVRKNNVNLKTEHFKNETTKVQNVTKNVTKPNFNEFHDKSPISNITKNLESGENLCDKNVTKSDFSVSLKKVTKKPPETSINNKSENSVDGTILLKKEAYASDKNKVSVSRNVSIKNVTKKPPQTSSNNTLRNYTSGTILQKKPAYASTSPNERVSRNVSIKKVTKKAPKTKCFNKLKNIREVSIMQKKEAYAQNVKKNGVSRSFVTSKPAENSYISSYENNEVPENLHKIMADAKMLQKNVKNNSKIHRKSGSSTINNCYENNEVPENLVYDNIYNNLDYTVINESDEASLSDEEYYNDMNSRNNQHKYTNSNNYYNNFEAPPVMSATPPHHHSPNKLYTTQISRGGNGYSRSYNRSQHYEEHNLDEEEHFCQYCGRTFQHRQSKWRHEKKCSEKNVLANKCNRLEQQNKEKDKAIELLKAQMEIMMEKVGGEVHNHNTTNYTVNTVNIMLNAFGSETTDYLTESKVKEILQQGGAIDSIPRLLKAIHFDPGHIENKNVIIPSRKDNVAKIWDGSKWVLKAKNTTINEMTDKAFSLITEHYEEGNKHYDEFTDKYARDDKNVKKRVTQDTELMIINSTNDNSKSLTIPRIHHE